jgi:hypothetical protein
MRPAAARLSPDRHPQQQGEAFGPAAPSPTLDARDALAGILATGADFREAAALLMEAVGPLAAAATLASRLEEDPFATLQGLAAIAADPRLAEADLTALRSRLKAWPIHPLSIAMALDAPDSADLKRLAIRLGTASDLVQWLRPDRKLIPWSNGQAWPSDLRIIPLQVQIPPYTRLDAPSGTLFAQDLDIRTEPAFFLPQGLTVLGDLDLHRARGWDEVLPEGTRVEGRVFVAQRDLEGTTVEAWRRFKAFEAAEAALGGNPALIRREAGRRLPDWERP